MQNSGPSKNSRDTPMIRDLGVASSALPPLDFLQDLPENPGGSPHLRNEIPEVTPAISAISAIRETEPAPEPQPETDLKTPSRRPEGSALEVQPSWWPGPPFLVARSERERDALITEGESPGMVWTLDEARKLAGLKPKEKLYLARVKAEFNGQMGRVRPVRSGDGP